MIGKRDNETTYLFTRHGYFNQLVPEGTEGAVAYETEGGKVYYLKQHNFVRGYINDIVPDIRTAGDYEYHEINVHIEDGDERVVLRIEQTSSAAASFFSQLPNVDFTKEVDISIRRKEKRDTIFIRQQDDQGNWKNLTWAWTKSNPGPKPSWRKVIVRGKEEWDNSEEVAFFLKVLREEIVPRIHDARISSGTIEDVAARILNNEKDSSFDPF